MTTVYLIRHAEAEGNLYRRIHGQYDSLITPDGHRQIAALAERFRDIPVDACWSSDLTRARTTARAVYVQKNLPLHTDPRFREIGMGVWEDMPFGEIHREYGPQLDVYNRDLIHWHVPDCEPYDQFISRFREGLDAVAAASEGKTVCVVSHGGIIRASLREMFFPDLPWNEVGQSDNTGVTKLEYDGQNWKLCYRYDNSHLPPELSTTGRLEKRGGKNMEMWFRPVDVSDMVQYIRFRQDAWQHIYKTQEGFDGQAFWRDARQTTTGSQGALLFSVLGTEVTGILQLNPLRGAGEGIGYIPFIYLREAYRNQGLGIQLIGQAVSYYRRHNRTRLQLSVAPGNAHALHFYQKYGFEISGRTKGRFGSLYLMDRDIDLAPWREDAVQETARQRLFRRLRR